MKKKSLIAITVITTMLGFSLPSCKPTVKDADIVNKIETSKAGMPDMNDVTITVKDGVATLTGTVPSEQAKSAAENNVKSVEGVKSVVNNLTVVTPPPPPQEFPADDVIKQGVNTAIKDFKNVTAEVKEGVITLTGEIKRDELPKLMQMLHDLKPKNVVNNLTIK